MNESRISDSILRTASSLTRDSFRSPSEAHGATTMSIKEKLPTMTDALRLLFPPSCPSCGVESDSEDSGQSYPSTWRDDGWCRDCRVQIDPQNSCRCQSCAAVLAQPSPYSRGCASCYRQDLPFELAVSVHNYQGLLRHLVIQAKNAGDETLMAQLGRLLGSQIKKHPQTADSDLMISIPSHWKRRFFSKGFHAASLIAQNVEKMTGIPHSQRILCSVKPTLKQGTLSRTARLKNVRNAFACKHPKRIVGRNVLLIDDVMTSGATMIEATRVLKRAGAKKVIVAAIARATSVD